MVESPRLVTKNKLINPYPLAISISFLICVRNNEFISNRVPKNIV